MKYKIPYNSLPHGYMVTGHPPIGNRTADALVAYVEHGGNPGQQITAVLRNDLRMAIAKADAATLRELPSVIGWLCNTPGLGALWGNPDAVLAHMTNNS